MKRVLFLSMFALFTVFCFADTIVMALVDSLSVQPEIIQPVIKKVVNGDIVFGTTAPKEFIGLMFFALIGVAIRLLLGTTNRNVEGKRSPVKFNWLFFIQDNWKQVVLVFLLVYVSLRFSPELLGVQMDYFVALSVGFGYDLLMNILKKKTGLKNILQVKK